MCLAHAHHRSLTGSSERDLLVSFTYFVDKIKDQGCEVTWRRSPSRKQAGGLVQGQPCGLEPTDPQFKPLISTLSCPSLRILAVSWASSVEVCSWESQPLFLLVASPLLLDLWSFCWALRDPLCSGSVLQPGREEDRAVMLFRALNSRVQD